MKTKTRRWLSMGLSLPPGLERMSDAEYRRAMNSFMSDLLLFLEQIVERVETMVLIEGWATEDNKAMGIGRLAFNEAQTMLYVDKPRSDGGASWVSPTCADMLVEDVDTEPDPTNPINEGRAQVLHFEDTNTTWLYARSGNSVFRIQIPEYTP